MKKSLKNLLVMLVNLFTNYFCSDFELDLKDEEIQLKTKTKLRGLIVPQKNWSRLSKMQKRIFPRVANRTNLFRRGRRNENRTKAVKK